MRGHSRSKCCFMSPENEISVLQHFQLENCGMKLHSWSVKPLTRLADWRKKCSEKIGQTAHSTQEEKLTLPRFQLFVAVGFDECQGCRKLRANLLEGQKWQNAVRNSGDGSELRREAAMVKHLMRIKCVCSADYAIEFGDVVKHCLTGLVEEWMSNLQSSSSLLI